MKVNSAELKTHLGKYLRAVEQDAATLEVCVRERTVAYLVPAQQGSRSGAAEDFPLLALKQAGMKIRMPAAASHGTSLPLPVLAGDGQVDVVSTDEMRKGRDW